MMMLYTEWGIKKPKNTNFIWSQNYVCRAGIIPFMKDYNGTTWLLLGIAKDNGKFADLGGRTEKDETTLETARREYGEESRWCLPVNTDTATDIVISKIRGKRQVLFFYSYRI